MKIGFIGLGNMGRGVCHRLIEAKYAVTAYDCSMQALERFKGQVEMAEKAEDVFAQCDLIFLSLPNSKIVEKTIDIFLRSPRKHITIIDLSTSNPISTRSICKKLEAVECTFLDAPLSSGPQQAWEGTMEIVVAGDKETVDKYNCVFLSFCKRYDYVGESGNAHLIKLAKNWASLLQAMIYAQLYPTMEKLGIPAKKLYHILDTHVLSNWVFQFYGKKFVSEMYPLDFSLELGYKDILYMKELCESVGAPSYMLEGAVQLCEDTLSYAKEQDMGTIDMSYVSALVKQKIYEQEDKR